MRKLVWLFLFVLLVAGTASATTIIIPSEDKLISSSDVIALTQVTGISSKKTVAGAGYSITTEITLKVLTGYKGTAQGATLNVYQLGGRVGESIMWLDGSPEYVVGERALVFLRLDVHQVLHTSLMTVGRIPVTGSAKSPMLGASFVHGIGNEPIASFQKRLLGRFKLRVGPPVTFRSPPTFGATSTAAATTAFKFMQPPSRWRLPSIPVWGSVVGDSFIGLPASVDAIRATVGTWGSVPNSNLSLTYMGEIAPQGMACAPGKIAVTFNDPNKQITDQVGCQGVLAVGGFCASGVVRPDGFQDISGGMLTFNNGWDSCGFWSKTDTRNFKEVMTHEMGHTLGLAHSCESGQTCSADLQAATMFWMAHFDGRAAGLMAYDQAAFGALYPKAVATPVPTVKPTPKPTAQPVATPLPVVTLKPAPPMSGCGAVKPVAK